MEPNNLIPFYGSNNSGATGARQLQLQRAQLQEYAHRMQLGLRVFPGQYPSVTSLSYHLMSPYFHPYLCKDPRTRFVHEEPKPNHSYIGLIAMAILSSRDKQLILSDIYQWILDNYNYFRTRGPGWRNSIRHNLSLNDCFIKAGRSANGKGHYWAIHPANIEDFQKGDFRRRRAQRRVRRHMGLSVTDDDDDDSPIPSPVLSNKHGTSSWSAGEETFTNTLDLSPSLVNQGAAVHGQTSPGEVKQPAANSISMSESHNSPEKRVRRLFDIDTLLAPDIKTEKSPFGDYHGIMVSQAQAMSGIARIRGSMLPDVQNMFQHLSSNQIHAENAKDENEIEAVNGNQVPSSETCDVIDNTHTSIEACPITESKHDRFMTVNGLDHGVTRNEECIGAFKIAASNGNTNDKSGNKLFTGCVNNSPVNEEMVKGNDGQRRVTETFERTVDGVRDNGGVSDSETGEDDDIITVDEMGEHPESTDKEHNKHKALVADMSAHNANIQKVSTAAGVDTNNLHFQRRGAFELYENIRFSSALAAYRPQTSSFCRPIPHPSSLDLESYQRWQHSLAGSLVTNKTLEETVPVPAKACSPDLST